MPGMQLSRSQIQQQQIETEKRAMAKFRAQKERAYREKQEREEEARRKQMETDRFARLTRMGLNGLEITEYLELERTFAGDEQGRHDSVRARKRYVRFDRSERKILRQLSVDAERMACFSSEMDFEEARRFMRMPSETRKLYYGLKPASRAIFAHDLSANERTLMHGLQSDLRDAFAAMPVDQRHVWTSMHGFATPAGRLFWQMNDDERKIYMALRKRDFAVNGTVDTGVVKTDNVAEEGDSLDQGVQGAVIDHSEFTGVERRDACAGADAACVSFAHTYLFMNDAERALFLSIDEGDRAEMTSMPQDQRDVALSLQPWQRAAFFDMGSNDVRANYLAADDAGRAAIMARRGRNMHCSKFEFAASRKVPGDDRGWANAWHVSHLSHTSSASRPSTALGLTRHAGNSRKTVPHVVSGRGGSRRDCSSRAGRAESIGGSVHCIRLLPESHRSDDARLRQQQQVQKRTDQRRCGQAQLPVSISKMSLSTSQTRAKGRSQTTPYVCSALLSPSVTSSWHSMPSRAMASQPSSAGATTVVMAGGPYVSQDHIDERATVTNTAVHRLWRNMTGGRPVLVDRSSDVRRQAKQHTQALIRGRCSRPIASAKWQALAQTLQTCARAGCISSTGPLDCILSAEANRMSTSASLKPPHSVGDASSFVSPARDDEVQANLFGTDLLRGDLLAPTSPPQELPDVSNKVISQDGSSRAHATSVVARVPSPKMTVVE